MRHAQIDPAPLKTMKLQRLFAIQRHSWRQNGFSDIASETPLTAADLALIQARAMGSLTRPRAA